MTRWMTCREFLDFLWAYLSSEVTDAQRAEFEYHLSGCPSCVAYMKSYQKTVELGKAAFEATDEPLPDDVPDELVEAILATIKKPE
ncbi:MAG TPA: zf-HC2 domain-containing protein [Thermoanaerobaculia bacterium]|nr:zf-HC2 domain-containing protein [Thermoanaerobaculia bacterium]